MIAAESKDRYIAAFEQWQSNGNGAAPAFKEGVGLSNTRARLEQLYGDAYLLAFKNGEPRGLIVTLEIPLAYQTEDSSDENERAVD